MQHVQLTVKLTKIALIWGYVLSSFWLLDCLGMSIFVTGHQQSGIE